MSATIFDPPRTWIGSPRTEADYWRRLAKIYEHGLRCVANTKTNPEGWATDQQVAEHYLEQGALTSRPGFTETAASSHKEESDNLTPPEPMSKTYQPAPGEVLKFAEHVARKVRTSRKDRLRAGKITDAEAARDVACADELARMAKEQVLVNAPLG